MNYHFTTTRALIEKAGGKVVELVTEEGLKAESDCPFKGNLNVEKLEALIKDNGSDKIGFVRLESGTNLIGGQPVSLENMQQTGKVCKKYGIRSILDASLLADA